MSKAFTSEETPDEGPLVRPPPRLAPGEVRYVTPEGAATEAANRNGSVNNIAGICSANRRVLGLMPHPERHLSSYEHPQWTRKDPAKQKREGDGLAIFRSGVNFAKKYL